MMCVHIHTYSLFSMADHMNLTAAACLVNTTVVLYNRSVHTIKY
jgi:hypothetical protein